MSMTGQDVVNRAQVLLNDSGNSLASVAANTRWPVAELLLWITDAQREAVIVSPNSNNVIITVPLVAGTKQSLATANPEAWILLSVKRNLKYNSTAQTYSGARAIRQTTQEILDAFEPNWHTDAPATIVMNFMFDVNDRKAFFVYPPSDGTGFVEANVCSTPNAVSTLNQVLDLDDIYLGPLASYVCYRALTKDAEFAGGASLAQTFYSQFYNSMKAIDASETTDSPSSSFATPAPQQPALVPPPQGRK